ncbi:MAG: hypothetical protein ACHQF3_05080 [Alphaproteobacteria bacterium]
MPKPSISRETFAALVVSSGLTLTAAETSELHAAYGHVEAMAARVRGDGKRPPEVEPAVVFKPEAPRA